MFVMLLTTFWMPKYWKNGLLYASPSLRYFTHRFFVYSLLTYRSLAVGDQHMMERWVLIVKDKDLHLCLLDRLKIGSKLEGPIRLGLIAGGLSNKKALVYYFITLNMPRS